MQFPDDSIFLQHTQGDSGFENVYIYGKLNYDFKNDDIVVKSINVTSPSVFSGDVAFSGDITLDEITSTPHFSQTTPRYFILLYFPHKHSKSLTGPKITEQNKPSRSGLKVR